ncbi:MAG: glycoside hydrolase family 2 TIM barrel-domain containing protein, partial [Bacteroidota bacterium]
MKFKLLFIITFISAVALARQREVTLLNEDWKYLEENFQYVEEASAASGWEQITLPHTWNNLDATDLQPGYRRDASWYQKKMMVRSVDKDQRYFLYFEGVNIVSEVFVNGKKAGGHIGGYLGFEVEITEFLENGQNTIMVRVDNGYNREIVPSQKSDFFIYGGITRDVWLKKVNKVFLADVKVKTPKVSKAAASTEVVVEINGEVAGATHLLFEVKDPSGKTVYQKKRKLQRGERQYNESFEVKSPVLWDVDAPKLHKAIVTLFNGTRQLDAITSTYGYRWFKFEKFGAFYLNGEKLLLRGTHRHEEHAGYGAAMPNQLHRSDMELIKSMGANFVRLGHYPQDPEVYRACDDLGLLIWDEIPWCRGGVGNEAWKTNTKNMLVEMINQNYNHPSVILWSLGNEIDWLPDFPDGSNDEHIRAFLTELNELSHQMDPDRPTSIRKYYEGSDIVDVFSPSIWSGWYSGSYKNYEKVIRKYMKMYPHFVHMEYGGSSHFGRHTENPIDGDGLVNPDEWEEAVNQVEVVSVAKAGDWSENYIVDLFDWHLKVSESQDQFVGNAQWAFKDFGTPLRPENDIPYMNQKG